MADHSHDEGAVNFVKEVQELLSKSNQSEFVRVKDREELYYAAVFCEAFSDFLKPHGHRCFHQLPLHTNSRPDFYVTSLKGNNMMDMPKLVADFKKNR